MSRRTPPAVRDIIHRKRRRPLPGEGGYTLLELVIVVIILLVLTTIGAVGLTSQVPKMKMKAQVALVLNTLRSARERALADQVTWKVRFHQTGQVTDDKTGLWKEDSVSGSVATYGLHQFIFAAPVAAWYESQPSVTMLPTQMFPALLKDGQTNNIFDAGLPATTQIDPILYLTSTDVLQETNNTVFPHELASLRLPGSTELESGVRITEINGKTTWNQNSVTTYYGDSPYDEPLPKNPNTLAPSATDFPIRPPAPASVTTYDDRIADATYSPDGVFRFQPVYSSGTGTDFTITFGNYDSLNNPSVSSAYSMTITLDYKTGFPHE